MSTGRQENATRDAASGTADAGVILMDLGFEALAIDQGAASILNARARGLRRHRLLGHHAIQVAGDVQDLMKTAEPAGPDSLKIRFLAGDSPYTGRTYLMEQKDTHTALIVLHLKREDAGLGPLAQVSSRYHLTEREHEVLNGIALGLTNKELANRMNIAPNTVKTFMRLVMAKMGVTRRTGIVAKLLEHIDVNRLGSLLQILLVVSTVCSTAAQSPPPDASCLPPLCVSRADDSSTAPVPGTLRFAVLNAPAGGVITFDPRLRGASITLDGSSPNNHIVIDRDLTIEGPGWNLLTVSGGNATRILFIDGGNTQIRGLTLADGLAKGGDGAPGTGGGGGGGGAAGMGGAIFLNGGSLVLSGVMLSRNRAIGGNGGSGGPTLGPGEGGGGGGFGGNGALGLRGAGASGDLLRGALPRAGSGGAGGDLAPAGVGGGDAGFGGGGGGGGVCAGGNGTMGGPGGGNGFGGGAGGAAGFLDADGSTVASSGGLGGAALGGAIFARSGFLELVDTSFIGNSSSGGLGAGGSANGPAKGGAVFLCAAEMCGAESDAAAVWSGNSSFRANTADFSAGAGCPGRGDTDVCGRMASSRVTHFGVAGPASANIGVPFPITVTALDADDIRVFSYAGVLRVWSSDRSAALPSDPRLAAGAGVFNVILRTPGSHTIGVADVSNHAVEGGSNLIASTRPEL